MKIEKYDLLCDGDGNQWTVHRVYSKTIHLKGVGKTEGAEKRIPHHEVNSYTKAVVPTTLKVGQTLYAMGHKCTVAGFMKPCFVLLSGTWGSDSEYENAVVASRDGLLSHGVRLPFPKEEGFSVVTDAKVEEK